MVYNYQISDQLNKTAYFPDSTVAHAKHSVQFKFIIDILSGDDDVS